MNLDQAKLANKTVVLRCDLNVPLQNGQITDDGREQLRAIGFNV